MADIINARVGEVLISDERHWCFYIENNVIATIYLLAGMYKALLFIAFIFCGCIALGQEVDTSRFKVWHENDVLQWKDYTISDKKVVLENGFTAGGATSYQYIFKPKALYVDSCTNLITVFLKADSWMKDTLNPLLLEHERIHFDIAEIYARILRKELFALYVEGNKKEAVCHLKIDSLFKACSIRQQQYDKETLYGLISGKQQAWRDTVTYELEQLHDFTFENMALKCKACQHCF